MTERSLHKIARVAAMLGCMAATPVAAAETGKVAELAAAHGLEPDQIGYHAVDLATGETLAAHRREQGFIPASVSKIVTTLAALEVLGAEHRFVTCLGYRGELQAGALKGDLHLRGTGDPVLTHGHLFAMARAVRRAGIERVRGDIVADDSFLGETSIIDPDGERHRAHNAGVSALSAEFNRIGLRRGGSVGAYTVPKIAYLGLKRLSERLPAHAPYRYADNGDTATWQISAGRRLPRRTALPVRQPTRYTASLLRAHLRNLGIAVGDVREGPYPDTAETLHVNRGRPVLALAQSALEYSNNVVAELLALRTARELEGRAVGTRQAGEALAQWLRRNVDNGPWQGLKLANGSGLTSDSRLTPAQATATLAYAADRRYGGRDYWSLLSPAGAGGWLKDRLDRPEHALRVWAKTGTLDYVSAIAGLLLDERARRVAFAIFVTDYERRARLDQAGRALDKLRGGAPGWSRRARALQDALLRDWVGSPDDGDDAGDTGNRD